MRQHWQKRRGIKRRYFSILRWDLLLSSIIVYTASRIQSCEGAKTGTSGDERHGQAYLSETCDFLETYAVLILSMIASMAALGLFYRNKLKPPIEELHRTSQIIAQNDMDFQISYENRDELGQLCLEFDRMPLSVLRGYQEMILEFILTGILDREKLTEILQEGMGQTEGMNLEECVQFFEEQGIFGSEYAFEDAEYHQGSAAEVNQYIEEKLKDHPYSAHFARKFADSCSLHMGFFATVLLAFLFLQDTRKNTYELIHTKPLTAMQYLCGKIGGGMLVIAAVLAFLNFLFFGLCAVHAREAGFTAEPWSFLIHTALYILPTCL